MTPTGETPENRRPDQQRLADYCLQRCLELSAVLRRCLEDERRALESRDGEALERALTSKRECVRQLHEADIRQQLTGIDGSGTDGTLTAGDVERHLDALDGRGQLTSRWHRLVAETRACRELNTLNGRLAGGLRERTEQTLLLLRSAAGEPGIYGPDGHLDQPRLVP